MDRFEPNLRIPGPTALPPSVREAGARQMINHRGPEFAAMLDRILTGMKPFFGTTGDIAMLTCAGTGGLEAAVVNTLSPGDRVLGVSIGSFGDRFAKIAGIYGADVDEARRRVGPGGGSRRGPRARWPRTRRYKAVLLTHNETSTGVMNPIPDLAAAIRDVAPGRADPRRQRVGPRARCRSRWTPGASTSSSPARRRRGWPRRASRWSPPRSAAGPRWRRRRCRASTSTSGRTATRRRTARRRSRPRSPSSTRSTRASGSCRQEGAAGIFARHEACAAASRAGLQALGFELFADERYASQTVTAAKLPEGHDWKAFNGAIKAHGVVLAGGQGKLTGKIFRLGHLGSVTVEEILGAIAVLETVALEQGRPDRARRRGRRGVRGRGRRARASPAAAAAAIEAGAAVPA